MRFIFFDWGRSQTTFTKRGGPKCPLFVNVHKVKYVNVGGSVVKKKPKSCQRSLWTNFSQFKEYFFQSLILAWTGKSWSKEQKDYLPSNRAEQALDDTRIPYLLPSLPLFLFVRIILCVQSCFFCFYQQPDAAPDESRVIKEFDTSCDGWQTSRKPTCSPIKIWIFHKNFDFPSKKFQKSITTNGNVWLFTFSTCFHIHVLVAHVINFSHRYLIILYISYGNISSAMFTFIFQ